MNYKIIAIKNHKVKPDELIVATLESKNKAVKLNLVIEDGFLWIKRYQNNELQSKNRSDAKGITSILFFNMEYMKIFGERVYLTYSSAFGNINHYNKKKKKR